MQGAEVQPHLQLSSSMIKKNVIFVTDQYDAKILGSLVDTFVEIASNREYYSYNCTYKDISFTIITCGTGHSGATVAFEEAIYLGVENFIIATEAYSISSEIQNGDIFISTAAVRDEGLTKLIIPLIYPAVCHPTAYQYLIQSVEELSFSFKTGISVSTALLYYPHNSKHLDLNSYISSGAKIVELESSSLMILASMHTRKASTIHCIIGKYSENGFDESSLIKDEDKVTLKTKMYSICLRAIEKAQKGK